MWPVSSIIGLPSAVVFNVMCDMLFFNVVCDMLFLT